MQKRKTVFVGMSGGVDSSVAAYLLKKQDYNVVGVFMRCYNIDGCAERDAEDARRVAGHLGIPFYVWDFEEEYKRRVVEYMIDGYRRGFTPNPDVECNREVKFGLFFDRARALGADYVATGHYVRCQVSGIRYQARLLVAKDKNKDQSYFLWTFTQKQLAHCLFPIGEYTKPQVRAIARRAKLPTANKKDSQGVCFLGNVAVGEFLKKHIKPKRGDIVATDGTVVGKHDGAYFYTIGQRHLGSGIRYQVSGVRKNDKDPKRLYVAEKNVKKNTLTVVPGDDHPALYRKEVVLRGVNFLANPYSNVLENIGIGDKRSSVMARVRYRQPLAAAMLRRGQMARGKGQQWKLVFQTPQKFVAPGQSAVFYKRQGTSNKRQGEYEMLGGGIIV